MSIIFKCENADNPLLEFSKMNIVYLEGTYLYNLIEIEYNKEAVNQINLDIDKMALKSILDSLKLNTLVIYEGVNLDYLHGFATKWCLPNWFLDQLKVELIGNIKFKTIISAYNTINRIKLCTICNNGFNEAENDDFSCIRHLKKNVNINGIYECCGKTCLESKGCQYGYHVSYGHETRLFIDTLRKCYESV